MNNPNIYANFLALARNMTYSQSFEVSVDTLSSLSDTNTTLNEIINNITYFKALYSDGRLGPSEVYMYVYNQVNGDSKRAYRLFINNLTFGFCQIVASIL